MLMTDIIKAAIPNASDDTCEFILWSRTPFPVGAITAKSLYKAAARVQRCAKNGTRLCEFCDNLVTKGKWTCEKCETALSAARELSN